MRAIKHKTTEYQ